jgi:hypothetical protein
MDGTLSILYCYLIDTRRKHQNRKDKTLSVQRLIIFVFNKKIFHNALEIYSAFILSIPILFYILMKMGLTREGNIKTEKNITLSVQRKNSVSNVRAALST